MRLYYCQASLLGASKARFIGCKSIHPKGRLNCTQVLNGSPVGYICNLVSLCELQESAQTTEAESNKSDNHSLPSETKSLAGKYVAKYF